MPEMTFTVRWPDGAVQECYSPSLVIHDHLQPETSYTVGEFSRRATEALDEAAERVRAKFGFACTSAAARMSSAVRYPTESMVEVVTMHPPLPIT